MDQPPLCHQRKTELWDQGSREVGIHDWLSNVRHPKNPFSQLRFGQANMGGSTNRGTPKSSISRWDFPLWTIHVGVALFWETPNICRSSNWKTMDFLYVNLSVRTTDQPSGGFLSHGGTQQWMVLLGKIPSINGWWLWVPPMSKKPPISKRNKKKHNFKKISTSIQNLQRPNFHSLGNRWVSKMFFWDVPHLFKGVELFSMFENGTPLKSNSFWQSYSLSR